MQPAIVTKFSRDIHQHILQYASNPDLGSFWFKGLMIYAQSCKGLRASIYGDMLQMLHASRGGLFTIVEVEGNIAKESHIQIEKVCDFEESKTKSIVIQMNEEYVVTAHSSFYRFQDCQLYMV